MGCENIPIQMIVHCDEKGILRPLRFQIRDDQNKTHTVQIGQVIDSRKTINSDGEAIMYFCKANVQGKERLFELKYQINTQQWLLFRQIY